VTAGGSFIGVVDRAVLMKDGGEEGIFKLVLFCAGLEVDCPLKLEDGECVVFQLLKVHSGRGIFGDAIVRT
jgi:hypothetical protein